MSCICSICLDYLNRKSPGDAAIVATSCGHVFHRSCVTEWFEKLEQEEIIRVNQSSAGEEEEILIDIVAGNVMLRCPFCSSEVTEELKQLYLVEPGESSKTGELQNGSRSLSRLEEENGHLSEQLVQMAEKHEEEVSSLMALYRNTVKELDELRGNAGPSTNGATHTDWTLANALAAADLND